jgi:HAD superfamily hydrolase (TIGR01549 family)
LITTLLLDLDDTLLKNDIDEFLPKYLEAFSRFVSDQIEPGLFVQALLAGTKSMVQNRRPDRTLNQVFDATFFPLVGIDRETFRIKAESFYTNIFPKLQYLTEPVPGAVDVVKEAIERGYRLAITTNPLFPKLAIQHRLRWAGLDPEHYHFDLISSYEKFHFSKPDPAYFAEALGRLGWPDEGVVVVGDDPDRDIAAGGSLGLSTYRVDSSTDSKPSLEVGSGGSLLDFYPWLDRVNPVKLRPSYQSTTAWLATLRSTPAVLHAYAQDLNEVLWKQKPAQNEWGFTEILCHLRDVDREVNLPRLQKVVQSNNPFLPGQDTDPWAQARQYFNQDGRLALQQFIDTRQLIVEILESLDVSGWERPARHAIFGPTRLQELVDIIASHDRIHLQQVYRLIEEITSEQRKV